MTASVAFLGVARDRWRDLEQTVVEAYLRGLQDAGWRVASDQLRFGFAASSALRYGPGCVRLILPALLDETAQPHVELVLGIPFNQVLQLWAAVCLEQVRLAEEAFGSSSRSMYEAPARVGWQVGLRQMLADDGVSFSASDLAPALDLLTVTGTLVRPIVAPNLPRQGWIPLHAHGEDPEPAPSPERLT